MDKRYIDPGDYMRDQWRLAAKIRASGWKPDFLVGLWRGGAPAAIAVHEFLRETGWDVRHLPLKSASYTGIAQTSGKVEFLFGDETFSLFGKGDKVLFVDDVYDTGGTSAALEGRMQANGADWRLACVYVKRTDGAIGRFPDYFVEDFGKDWIVFPHEIDGLSPEERREKDAALAALIESFA